MPTVEIVIGSDKLSIDTGSLASALKEPIAEIKLVSDALNLMRGKAMSELTDDFLSVSVSVSPPLQWDVPFSGAAGVLTITVDPSLQATLTLRRAGEVLQLGGEVVAEGDDIPMQPPPPALVPPGLAYVSLSLRVSFSASVDAALQHGPFGVMANVGTDQRFLVAYHHAVKSDTVVADALKEAFTSFVLPYATDSLLGLRDFCYSEFEYVGEMSFGLEATVGYSGTLLLGTSKRELALTKDTEIGKFAFSVKPEYQVGATLQVGYSHLDAFRVVAHGLDANRLSLFYFKMDQSAFSIGFTVAAQAHLNPGMDIELARKITDRVDAELDKLVPATTPKRDELLAKWKADVLVAKAEAAAMKRIQDFLARLEKPAGLSANVQFHNISVHTALIGYEFDRVAGLPSFHKAMEGNLRDAIRLPGITVAVGSYVRDSITRRTSVGLAIFGREAVSMDQFVQACDISFEGNGVFRLQYTGGRKTESKVFGHEKMVETLFTATTRAMGEGVIRDNDIRLRITLYQQNSADAARRSASALAIIVRDRGDAARRMKAAIGKNPQGAFKMVCTIAPSAFGKLTFTAFEAAGKPKELPHINDQANYQVFMAAFRSLYSNQDGFLPPAADRYGEWTRVAGALNGDSRTEPPKRPNRRSWPKGPVLATSPWPQSGGLANVNKDARFAVAIVLEGARNFMNTCEDLATLAGTLDNAQTESAFKNYVQDMLTLAQKLPGSFPIHFMQPTLTALCARMNAEVANLDMPQDDEPRDEFAVWIDLR